MVLLRPLFLETWLSMFLSSFKYKVLNSCSILNYFQSRFWMNSTLQALFKLCTRATPLQCGYLVSFKPKAEKTTQSKTSKFLDPTFCLGPQKYTTSLQQQSSSTSLIISNITEKIRNKLSSPYPPFFNRTIICKQLCTKISPSNLLLISKPYRRPGSPLNITFLSKHLLQKTCRTLQGTAVGVKLMCLAPERCFATSENTYKTRGSSTEILFSCSKDFLKLLIKAFNFPFDLEEKL